MLYRWRSILIVALVGALLLGAYAYKKNKEIKERNLQIANASETEAMLENKYASDNEIYQGLLKSNLEYAKNSILMQIDADQEWQANTVYAIETQSGGSNENNPGVAVAIAAAYPSSIWTNWDEEKLSSIYGEEGMKYAAELFSAEAAEGSATFTVRAIGPTKEMAEQGLQYLELAIQRFFETEGKILGQYQLNKVTSYTIQGIDEKTEERKVAVAHNIPSFQGSISSNNSIIYNSQKGGLKELSLVKYAIIGFVLGGAGMVFLYVALFILNGRMQNRNAIQEQLGVPIYGEFRHSRAHRPGKGIDRLIEKWEFRNNKADRQTVVENICALLDEKGSENILIASTLPQAEIRVACEEIRKKAKPGAGIQIKPDILNSSQAIDAANQAQAIVLMEEKHVSKNKDIRRMAELLSMCDTPVIGAVIL